MRASYLLNGTHSGQCVFTWKIEVYRTNGTYKWAPQTYPEQFQGRCSKKKVARLKASTKVKSSDSAPLRTPISRPPKTSITSSFSFDSPLAPKTPLSSLSLPLPLLSKGIRVQWRMHHWRNLPNAWVSLCKRTRDIFQRKIRHSSKNGVAITWSNYMSVHLN